MLSENQPNKQWTEEVTGDFPYQCFWYMAINEWHGEIRNSLRKLKAGNEL